jgi:2,3,4,5-tetrahydropyridine-2,6-dicarboxylate N-succinyltransferase
LSSQEALRAVIDEAYEARAQLTPRTAPGELRTAVESVIELLNDGTLRVAQPEPQSQSQSQPQHQPQSCRWIVHEWLKKAVLLSFRINDNDAMPAGALNFYDKVPLKYSGWSADRFAAAGVRVVPPATVRRGAFVASNVVLMPSYVNVGAYVDSGTMVDTWATVGSCAQIGKNVHLSGGVGIGGVLEPLQASPTIIEDNCFIGARSEIVEGVVVESGAVISMGVFIGQSTRIYDRERDEILYGRVPTGAVVVPGTLPAANGKYALACAVIVKRVDAKTRAKTSLNDLLRNTD